MRRFVVSLLGLVTVIGLGAFSGCGLLGPEDAESTSISINSIGSLNAGDYANVTGTVDAKDDTITAISYGITDANGAAVATAGITASGPAGVVGQKKFDFTTANPIRLTTSSTTPAGSYNLKITVTAGGNTTDFSAAFTVTGAGPGPLAVTGTGKIANIFGPDTGSYNLVDGVRVPSSAANTTKDLMDMSLVGEGFAGTVKSGNGGTFAAATASDYANATAATVKALGDAATASSISVSTPGSVFVIKLGSSRGYAIVKVLTYDPNAGASTGANKGEMTFEYKFTN